MAQSDQKRIDRRTAWERFFDAVQEERPRIITNLRRVALRPFEEVFLSQMPQRARGRKRDRTALSKLIADAPTFSLDWRAIKSSSDPKALKLKATLEEWATNSRMPQGDDTQGDDTMFDLALEILFATSLGRGSRLPWALPKDEYMRTRVSGSSEPSAEKFPLRGVSLPTQLPGESRDRWRKRVSPIVANALNTAYARNQSVVTAHKTPDLPFLLFVRNHLLRDKQDAIALDSRISTSKLYRSFKEIKKALGVKTPRGRPPNGGPESQTAKPEKPAKKLQSRAKN